MAVFSLSGSSSSNSSSDSLISLSSSPFAPSPQSSPRRNRRTSPISYTNLPRRLLLRQLGSVVLIISLILFACLVPLPEWRHGSNVISKAVHHAPSSTYAFGMEDMPDPQKWLAANSHNRYTVGKSQHWSNIQARSRPRAALISLVRNSKLEGILQSMRQLEERWNHKYQYSWIFFNDESFDDDFKVIQVLCIRLS